ncbi:unnamed protein product, partial [Musa textilis]
GLPTLLLQRTRGRRSSPQEITNQGTLLGRNLGVTNGRRVSIRGRTQTARPQNLGDVSCAEDHTVYGSARKNRHSMPCRLPSNPLSQTRARQLPSVRVAPSPGGGR